MQAKVQLIAQALNQTNRRPDLICFASGYIWRPKIFSSPLSLITDNLLIIKMGTPGTVS